LIKDLFNCEQGQRMTGDDRRRQILQTAVNLFSTYGFRGTTTKKIAEAAGVSEAMVFKHFSTKEDLYGAILHEKACEEGSHRFPWESNEPLHKAIVEKDDFGVFYHIALTAMNKQQADVGFMRLMFFSALEDHDLAERFFTEFVSKVYEFIGGYVGERQMDGAMREINPRVVVRAFIGMILHHSLNNILWDKKQTLLKITNEEAAKNFAEIILHGVGTNNQPAN
jgi:AcrR family transcriptional regulator